MNSLLYIITVNINNNVDDIFSETKICKHNLVERKKRQFIKESTAYASF